MNRTWLVALGIGKFYLIEAEPLPEALKTYREGKIQDAAKILGGAKAYIAYVEDQEVLDRLARVPTPFLYRGGLSPALNLAEDVDEARLGLLLEGYPEEEEDLPISLRRLISDPGEFHRNYGRGDEVFSGYLHRDLLGRCSQGVLEIFPEMEVMKERP